MGKAMKIFISLCTALLFNGLMGAVAGAAVGISPLVGALGMNAVSVVVDTLPSGLRAGVLKEVWTGEVVKALRGRLEGSWLDGIPDSSSVVENDVIHLVDAGVDPDVLINNENYPIALQDLEDQDIAISLDKFQTKVTPITDDELYAVSYDKMARVKNSHANAINDAKFAKAAHNLCGAENTAKTPVLTTSGKRDAATGRLKMTPNDIVAMKAALDKLGVPAENRRLVLCTDHVNDLLETSQSFEKQYSINTVDGKVARLYGFDIYEYAVTPYYTTAGKKKAVGAAAEDGEFRCSFAFYTQRVFKATGSTKMYYSPAATDPEYQRNKVNFRHYFICLPKKTDATAVMRSGYQAQAPAETEAAA